jgi:uncharacterized protein YgiM (DUF1202 family)
MKRIFQAFMAGAVILASALPASANTAKLSSPQIGNRILLSQNSTARVCTRDRGGRLNVRSGPGTRYRVAFQLPNRAFVSIYNSTDTTYGGYYWYQVGYGNLVGWVRGDFIC